MVSGNERFKLTEPETIMSDGTKIDTYDLFVLYFLV